MTASPGSKADPARPPTLIYIHVPKAAGTTLSAIIEQNYRPEETVTILHQPGRTLDDFRRLPVEQRERARMIKGHFPFGLHQFLPQPSTYFTVLRHPVQRALSHYYFVLRRPEHYLYEKVVGNQMSLEDYVGVPITPEMDNGQVRMISGCGPQVPIGECRREHLEQARRNLQERFALAGVAERFDEALLLCRALFGWKHLSYKNENVNEARPPAVTQKLAGLVEQNNALDFELYDFVSQRFRQQIERHHGDRLAAELSEFRLANRKPAK